MKNLNLFIKLIRLDKPIGFMLLFWPCIWGLTIAYNFDNGIEKFLYYAFLFFIGSVLMRSAGCIVNDIADKKFDQKVKRTKNRPIASGKISIAQGVLYTIVLCLIALLVLIQFNKLTILLAIISMPLAFIYPLMKRFTYWPQLFLGITFNYGLILGWTSIHNEFELLPILFYIGAIFWTLGYDTIYGYQDINDDEIIGVKSTSIKFKKNPKKIISICYLIFSTSLILVGILMNFNYIHYFLMLFVIMLWFYVSIKKLEIDKPDSCLKTFKNNNSIGFFIFLNLIMGKLLVIS